MSSIFGVILGLLTALSKTSADLISKHSLNTEINEYVIGWALRFFALPFLFVALLIFGLPESIEFAFYYSVFISGIISIIATVYMMKAYKLSDISIIAPLYSAGPILLLVTSPIMINEFPSPIGLFGVLLILIGLYVMKIKSAKVGFLEPIKAMIHEPGVKYMGIVLVLYSISANIDKIGTEASSAVFYSFSLHVIAVLGLTPLMILKSDNWKSEVKENTKYIIPMGLFNGLASVLYMAAFTYTLVIYVSAIKRVSTVTTVIGGWLILGEDNISERLPGAILIIFGVIFIALSLS